MNPCRQQAGFKHINSELQAKLQTTLCMYVREGLFSKKKEVAIEMIKN